MPYFSNRCVDHAAARVKNSHPSAMQSKIVQFSTEGESQESAVVRIYGELKMLARSKMAMERPGVTLNATALVHEAWMRLDRSAPDQWRDQSQFFAAASEAMRRILVERARRRLAAKRGAGEQPLDLDAIEIPEPATDDRVVAIHDALEDLEITHPELAEIVKLRFFCGLGNEEIASMLGVNEKTVRRHWNQAKLWLFQKIQEEP
jgi:RNA polymerase sigma factor (TIGR02999 family)